ncbi:hypothetical protein BDW72DRAFT_197472 [Aspergillus terricola var. indicus]
MPTPKRHGGGFIPAVKASLSFGRRSTTDQFSSGQDSYTCPQNESTLESTLPLTHDSNTTKRHGGGFNPSAINTKMPSMSATAQQQAQINPPAGVEITTVSLPQANSSRVKHGGGYLSKSHDNDVGAPAVSTPNHVSAQVYGNINQTAANNGHTPNEGVGGVERPNRRRHGGGYVPRGSA